MSTWSGVKASHCVSHIPTLASTETANGECLAANISLHELWTSHWSSHSVCCMAFEAHRVVFWCWQKKSFVLWTAAKKLDWKLSYGDAFSWVSAWAAMLCTIGNWEIHNFRPHPTHPLCEIWFAANLCCLSFPPLSYISFYLEGFSRFFASLHQWEDEKNINESTSTLVCGEKILKFNFPFAHLLRWL